MPDDAIATSVRDRAALILADTVGAVLAGSEGAGGRRLHAGADRAPGPATVLAEGLPRVEAWWAIVANGLAGTMLELDEGNRYARAPRDPRVPGRPRRGGAAGRSGAALLTALIVGYDVAARLGERRRSGPRCTCTGCTGPWRGRGGRAAQGARRGDRRPGARRGRRPYAGHVLAHGARGRDGANAYAGVGGANGWLAVDLAAAGVTPLPDMLTETFGRISGTGLDAALALDGLGERFEVTRNYFKRYACCRYNHPAVEALEELLAETAIAADRVASIRVATTALGATMADWDPVGALGAKFSIPYALAVRLVLGDCGVNAFREPPVPPRGARSPGAWKWWRIRAHGAYPRPAARARRRAARRRASPHATGGLAVRRVRPPVHGGCAPGQVRHARHAESRHRRRRGGLGSLPAPGLKSARELTDGLRALARPRFSH